MGGYVGAGKQPIALFDAYTKGQADGLFPDKTSATPQDFTAMPSVGGDPIVESGSNSDGKWTRWADGTQMCLRGSNTYDITFPLAFVSAPNVVAGDMRLSNPNQIGIVTITNITLTAVETLVYFSADGGSSFSESSQSGSYIAIGRWK